MCVYVYEMIGVCVCAGVHAETMRKHVYTCAFVCPCTFILSAMLGCDQMYINMIYYHGSIFRSFGLTFNLFFLNKGNSFMF